MREQVDRELVERAQRGDAAAIGELFSRYWRAARAVAYGVTGEIAAAEDAAAEGFRQALVGIDSLRDPERFGPWLRTIVVRQARQAVRGARANADEVVDDVADPGERADDALVRQELGVLIQRAVRELPDRLREAVALFYFEGYNSEAAAKFLDVPAGTLRHRLHDGRAELRGSVERILRGSKVMNDDRERQIEKVRSLMASGDLYQSLRGTLALRPPPRELVDEFVGRMGAHAAPGEESLREMAERFLRPSARAMDGNHPVGAVAAAIRLALPEFQEAPMDVPERVAKFFVDRGEYRERMLALLPPGFAEGRPGAFVRGSRAMVRVSEGGPAQSVFQVLEGSADEGQFRAAMAEMRMSDVLDLMWLRAGPLELRAVQELLERVAGAVLPGAGVRFSGYDEPRYRAALQMHLGAQASEVAARAACGGVLREWSGFPVGSGAGHVRVFLEAWAGVRSGVEVELERVPRR